MKKETTAPLLEVKNLKMYFQTKHKGQNGNVVVKAVDDVSFSVYPGETFGLVGESGCGKTTTGKAILRVLDPTDGQVIYKGRDIAKLSRRELKSFRRELQLIFQDPYSSLDPRQSVYSILKEAVCADHKHRTEAEIRERCDELMTLVDLDPVSALDVSIQAQIINLFADLQEKLGLTYIFVAHDLAVVRHIADRIGVMYLGHLIEVMDSAELFHNSLHPYTRALLSAVPTTDYYGEKGRNRVVLEGEVPSPLHAPTGCPFHPRCRCCTEECKQKMPPLQDVGDGHFVACFNYKNVDY